MSKSTPLEQLPQMGNNVNVKMSMIPEQQQNGMLQPRPQMDNSMSHDMNMGNEYQRMDNQDNYMKRQFVPQTNIPQPLLNDDYNNQNKYQQSEYQPQNKINIEQLKKNENNISVKSNSENIIQFFKNNSKILGIIFVLFTIIQIDTVQSMIRMLVRMTKVPDTMVFTVSKVFTSIIGVILFFICYRNL